jgi:hypothetical protein
MKNIKPIIYALIFLAIVLYTQMPVVQYGFTGGVIAILMALAIYEAFRNISALQNLRGHDWNSGRFPSVKSFGISRASKIIFGLGLIYVFALPLLTSSRLLHTSKFRNLIGNIDDGKELHTQMSPVPLDKIRIIDRRLASLLGDKVLGSQGALGSQVNVGQYSIQKVKDNFYWVAPLLHSGFLKWANNPSGCQGYIMVNACNERDVKLVQSYQGNEVRMKRHLYINGYLNIGLTDYTFEIDDTGKPFWVVTLYKKKIGFAGEDAVGVAVVDVANGAIEKYDIANTPAWIDRVQPEEFVAQQVDDWGEYIHGYFNFSNQGKLQSTSEPLLVYGNDNKSYWYSSLTSVGKDQSTVGFTMTDTRTKATKFYQQGGATPEAAMQSAEGKVQEKGYNAALPIPCNINNIPTYVTTLKDAGGLIKMYAMVSIADYTVVGVGNSLQEALMSYNNAYNQSGGQLVNQGNIKADTVRSVITRIQQDIKNGNSFYYFTIANSKKLFIGSSQLSNHFPLTKVGDSVALRFNESQQELTDIVMFKNLSME